MPSFVSEFIDPKTKVAPSGLSYSESTPVYVQGVEITANKPATLEGKATSYSVSPYLPNGLKIDDETGVISGSPDEVSSQTTYTITASNDGGFTNTTVDITVLAAPDLAVNKTQIDFHSQLPGESLSKSLTVSNNGVATLNWQINNSLSYLSFSQTHGTLDEGSSTSVTVTFDSTGLSKGTESDLNNNPDSFSVNSDTAGTLNSSHQIDIGFLVTDGIVLIAQGSTLRKTTDFISYSTVSLPGTAATIRDITYAPANGKFYLVRDKFEVLESTDRTAESWSSVVDLEADIYSADCTSNTGHHLYTIVYGDSKLLISGNTSSYYNNSTYSWMDPECKDQTQIADISDLTSWAGSTTASTEKGFYYNGRYILYSATAGIDYSTDGLTWSNFSPSGNVTAVGAGLGKYYRGLNLDAMYSSTDLTNWSYIGSHGGSGDEIILITEAFSKIFAASNADKNLYISDSSGINFSSISLPYAVTRTATYYNNNTLVIGAVNGRVLTSTDGTNFTVHCVPTGDAASCSQTGITAIASGP